MESNSPNFDALLERYIAGDRTADVVRAVDLMAAEYPLLRERLALLSSGVVPGSQNSWNTDASWNTLSARIASADRETLNALPVSGDRGQNRPRVTVSSPASRRSRVLMASAVAAALAVFVVQRITSKPTTETATHSVATGRGEQRRLQLSDSSIVVLGPMSTLRYAIGEQHREVELTGLATFTVRHDERRPFVVNAGSAQATDLGTEFTVRAYADENSVSVSVLSGRVAMSPKSAIASVAQLAAGDVGTLGAVGEVKKSHAEDAVNFSAWSEGQLIFHNESLGDVSRELARWFDVDIAVPDSAVARRRVEAIYSNSSLPNILNALSASLGVRYTQRGRVVTFSRGVK